MLRRWLLGMLRFTFSSPGKENLFSLHRAQVIITLGFINHTVEVNFYFCPTSQVLLPLGQGLGLCQAAANDCKVKRREGLEIQNNPLAKAGQGR